MFYQFLGALKLHIRDKHQDPKEDGEGGERGGRGGGGRGGRGGGGRGGRGGGGRGGRALVFHVTAQILTTAENPTV